ncbi:hypothetical protein [Cupriavidus sp. TMH.W2]|uniref:hypothetical protein n=1 Tax=Cupriavidus sp. TMH.W2 TaxID=3434465 RepID=UPI003D7711BF
MSQRMKARMRLLHAAGELDRQPEGETDAYQSLTRMAAGAALSRGPEQFREQLQRQYGTVYRPEWAPYGTHGYALYRVGKDGKTIFLCASSPFHGHQIPLTWDDQATVKQLAAVLGCSVTYACRGDGISGAAYLMGDGVVRFGNAGDPVLVPSKDCEALLAA